MGRALAYANDSGRHSTVSQSKKLTMAIRIFLAKNDLTENPKLPYFRLVLPPEEEGGKWTNIGALWKAKTGTGYSGNLEEGVTIDISKMKSAPAKAAQALVVEEADRND